MIYNKNILKKYKIFLNNAVCSPIKKYNIELETMNEKNFKEQCDHFGNF